MVTDVASRTRRLVSRVLTMPSQILTTSGTTTTDFRGDGVKRKSGRAANLLKGFQRQTAVLLLEAMVVLAAGAAWSGAWAQRVYGTGMADVWEMFDHNTLLTTCAWAQGWRPLTPLITSEFGEKAFHGYISKTLEDRSPRFVYMKTPDMIWGSVRSLLSQKTDNGRRQSMKRCRRTFNAFLDTV